MTQYFVEFNPVPEYELSGKLESEARELRCMIGGGLTPLYAGGAAGGVAAGAPAYVTNVCLASRCAHWRWLHRGGTRYEKRTFESEFPIPHGDRTKSPADVPDGWVFLAWDANMKNDTARPRFWASRAIEIVLPRGLCGLAGEE